MIESFHRFRVDERRALRRLALVVLATASLGHAFEGPNDLAVGTHDNVIAHIADGGQWTTSITLVNLSGTAVGFTLRFYGDNGLPLLLPIAGGLSSSVVTGNIPLYGTRTIQTAGDTNAQTVQGWAQVEAPSGAVGGFAVFRSRLPGQADFEAVVPMGSQSDHRFVMVFDNTKGYVIGAALANPSALQANLVTAIFRDENGTVIMQDTFAMKTLAHLAFALPERYPLTANKKGTVEFQSTGFLSGLGLRFNSTGPFTSFNVLSNVGW